MDTDIVLSAGLIFLGSLGLIWQITLSVISKKNRIDIFSPFVFFPILYSLLYGIGTIVYSRSQDVDFSLSIFYLYFSGLIAYYLGAIFAQTVPWKRSLRIWKPKKIRTAIVIIILFGVASYMYVLYRTGLPLLMADVETSRTLVVRQVGGYVMYFVNAMEIVLIFLFIELFAYNRSRPLRKQPQWIIKFLIAFLILVSLGARRKIAVPLLASIVIYNYLRHRIKLSTIIVIAGVGFLLLILTGSLRHLGSTQFDAETFNRVFYNEIVRGAGALDRLTEVIPSEFDYFGWDGALIAITSLAPGEQKLLSFILKEDVLNLKFSGGGYVPTIVGWFYVNFGGIGVFTGMFLFGLLLGSVFRLMKVKNNLFGLTLYSYLAIYSLVALRSGFLQFWPMFVIIVILLIDLFNQVKVSSAKSEAWQL
jgi:oligosaccharide repeat unit polymerase